MTKRKLALFDLDNTLLETDSDYQWAQFLIEEGVLDRDVYEAMNDRFYRQYMDGTLDIHEFLEFQLKPLVNVPREQLDAWHEQFMHRKIRPMIFPRAKALIERHSDALTAIVTATNRFITEPIAAELGVPNLLATDIEEVDGLFTGRPRGTPTFREGKIRRVDEWLADMGHRLEDFESWFYSDSLNDLPLLERVDNPIAVNPDAKLRAEAQRRGWEVIDLRDAPPADPREANYRQQ
ncbi:MAG TPA: HAD family hydrolase [Usitatibacter sp.]|nr:HAD family hydrolase [Usitatibacter sp.]